VETLYANMAEHVLIVKTYNPVFVHQGLRVAFAKSTSMIVRVDLVKMVLIALIGWQTTVATVGEVSLVETVTQILTTVLGTHVEMAEHVEILWMVSSAPVPRDMLVTHVKQIPTTAFLVPASMEDVVKMV